jgi:hypothetical protein
MSTRADIEAAFAEAEADLTRVVSILAKASADPDQTSPDDLPRAFSAIAKAKADVANAEADLAKARASCIAARDALARLNFAEGRAKTYRSDSSDASYEAAPENAATNWSGASEYRHCAPPAPASPNRSELIVKSNGSADRLINGAVNDPDSGTAASPSDRSASPQSAHARQNLEESTKKMVDPQKKVYRFPGIFSAQKASAGDEPAWRSLAWHVVQLSSLVLAYLQYYFMDVNLQIAKLQSVAPLFAG